MHHGRRTTDRRRRVLYTSHHADSSTPTAASRREAEKLREARRPPAAYGSRVQRRLRGRWFSLVPVRRRSLAIGSSIIVALSLLLCLAHYWSVTRAWLAYRPELARPLRLDHPDSFGRWVTCVLLAASSGVALLIYQLRRYRNDDYQGLYRMWRMVLLLLMVASVHSLVGLISWGGAVLDAAAGKRMALSGADWLRLVVGIGGAIMALRLIAEVRRSRWALAWTIAACGFFAVPEAANWNLIEVNSVFSWMLVTTSPLLACTSLFLALVGYLRFIFREVRQIEDNETLAERFQQFRTNIFRSERDEEEYESAEEELDTEPRRRWWGWRSKRQDDDSSDADSQEEDEAEYEDEDEYEYEDEDEDYEDDEGDWEEEGDAVAEDDVEEDDSQPRRKRRWFGLRAAKREPSDEELAAEERADEEVEPAEPEPVAKRRKKRRWSLRLDPSDAADQDETEEATTDEDTADETPQRRFGLSWRKKPRASDQEEAEPVEEPQPEPTQQAEPAEDLIDPNDIDWNSMSKSERRRLRKKLKRQGRAA